MAVNEIPDRAIVQLARAKAATSSGVATILLKIPAAGRLIDGGRAWFETPHFDDFISVYVTDEDNLLGYGAGAVIGGYTDTDVPIDNRGTFIPKTAPYVELTRLVDFGHLPGNMYLKIVGTTGDLRADNLRVNLHWGKPG